MVDLLKGIFFFISVYHRIDLGHVKPITFPCSKLKLVFLYKPRSTPSNYMRIKEQLMGKHEL